MRSNNNNPIGVFDSGLGGLTVVKELMRQLPDEDIVYFGDTARVPYGTKSKESIIRFSKENVLMLLHHRVKCIVVACNTASSLALATLKRVFPLPIIGVIDPGAKKAVGLTKNKRVGVIATASTTSSNKYPQSIHRLESSVKVFSQACPLFVPLAEEGWFDKKETVSIASEYLKDLKKMKVDTVILGCTHYPLLKTVIDKVMGKGVNLVDSAEEVAIEVKELLKKEHLQKTNKSKVNHLFLVSDEPKHFHRQAKRFLGCNIKNIKRCSYV